MTRIALTAIAIVLSVAPAAAAAYDFFESGNGLYEGCIPDGTKHIGTLRYIVGVVDTLNLSRQFGVEPGVCVPGDVTAQQMNDVVCLYETQHPANRNSPAPYIVVTALRTAFPCK